MCVIASEWLYFRVRREWSSKVFPCDYSWNFEGLNSLILSAEGQRISKMNIAEISTDFSTILLLSFVKIDGKNFSCGSNAVNVNSMKWYWIMCNIPSWSINKITQVPDQLSFLPELWEHGQVHIEPRLGAILRETIIPTAYVKGVVILKHLWHSLCFFL